MSHIYIGLTLSTIGVILAYFILSKFLLVALFLAILAGLHFKDDFIIFRYLATHVASIYLWFCEVYNNLVNMYHQSNNVNIPIRKRIEDNGSVSNKVNRVNHRLKPTGSHNLNSTYMLDTPPLGSDSWNTSPKFPNKLSLFSSRPQLPLNDLSKLNLNSTRLREDSINNTKLSISPQNFRSAVNCDKENPKQNTSNVSFSSTVSQNDNSPLLDARLLANVNSPGFCSRLAERLGDTMTHQPQYETVGAFPVVNLKSQSPKVKVKAPVRVRLAPPSNDLFYSNFGAQSPRLMCAEESMKSVLQVLKEISRKRIHSNVDEDNEDNSKRLRIGEGSPQTSLLQQTIQGKRAREDSSPNEDDTKKRRKPLQNNEILSSLSSSISIKPPHLKTQKRKAHDDPIILTPVLGKLLKVQPEIISPIITPSPTNKSPVQELPVKDTSPAGSISASHVATPVKPAEAVRSEVAAERAPVEADDDSTVSRLLGRMSRQVDQTTLQPQPAPVKTDLFASTNDLSLSPPKENRLAAMIAVLGGPCEELGITGSQSDSAKGLDKPIIKGKALFTTPETPETPKSTKKVTFSESLTATKIFDKNETSFSNTSTDNAPSVVSHSTPLTNLTFGISSSPVITEQKGSAETQPANATKTNDNSSLGLSQFSSGSNDPSNKIIGIANTTAVSKDSNTLTQQPGSFNLPSTMTSSPLTSGSTANGGSSNTSGSKIELNMPTPNKDNSLTQSPVSNTVGEKPFSFGAKATPANSGFTLSMSNSSGQLIDTKASASQDALTTTKSSFNMFASKNPAENSAQNMGANKPITNGIESTKKSAFTFSASTSVSVSNKLNPPLSTAPDNAPKSNTPFTFGSSSAPTTQVSSTTFQFSATSQTAAATVTSTALPTAQSNIFSNTSSQFGATVSSSSQNASIFGNSAPQTNISNPLTPASTQSSIFGSSATSVFGSTSQVGTNIATSSSQNNLFRGIASNTTAMIPSTGTVPTTAESTTNQGFGFVANGTFGVATSSTSQTSSIFGNSLTNTQASPMFGSVVITTAQNVSMFSTPATTAGQPPAFSLGSSQNSKSIFPNPSITPAGAANNSSAPTFGSQITTSATAFGNVVTPSPNAFGSQNTTSSGAFQSTNTTAFGSQTNMFGNQNASTTNAFGSQVSSTTNAFGSQNAPPTTNAFGSQVSSSTNAFGNQSIPTTNAFSSKISTLTNAFGNQSSSSTNAFGSQNPLTNNAFGGQNSSAVGAFGNQPTSVTASFNQGQNNAVPHFGTQNMNKPVTFENQTKNLTSTQTNTGFTNTGTFNMGQNTANQPQSKPFGSSPFMFGSTSTSKESGKPVGAAAPFSFGSSAQPAAPAAPSFGATTQQPPAFGSTISQPAPATPGPVFAFGQTPSAPGSTFQFNAAGPQPVQGGGMFSIGSGSMAPRSKTGALRRRHKPT